MVPFVNDKLLKNWRIGDRDLELNDPFTKQRVREPIHYYSDKGVASIVRWVSMTAAYGLTVVPVFTLHFVRSSGGRMAIIAAFALSFCIALAIFTTARRVEHYLALAGLTAVLVVFVGDGDANTCKCG